MLTYQQLTTPPTREQILQSMIDKLRELQFTATAWQPGSIAYSILYAIAWLYSGLGQVVYTLTVGRYSETATGEWLTRLSASEFGNNRQLTLSAQHTEVFTCEAGEGPYTFAVGDLVVSDGNRTFRNVTGGTVTSSAPLSLTIEDEIPGSAGNVATDTITQMMVSAVGVTCNNPAIASTGSSIVRYGLDAESDVRLRIRNRTKMPALSTVAETTDDKIVHMVLNAVPGIEKVRVDSSNPRGAGTADVYVAGRYAVASGTDIAAAAVVVQSLFLNPTARISTLRAESSGLAFQATVWCDPAVGKVAVQNLLEVGNGITEHGILKELLGDLPIGGNSYSSGPSNVLLRNELIQAIENCRGVVSVSIVAPATNMTIYPYDTVIAPSDWQITYIDTVVS